MLKTITFKEENFIILTLNPIKSTLNITNIYYILKGGYKINLSTRRLPLPRT
jgi:hypothetical protein